MGTMNNKALLTLPIHQHGLTQLRDMSWNHSAMARLRKMFFEQFVSSCIVSGVSSRI